MVRILDTPTASYRSTATMQAVREYIDQASDLFGKRRSAPAKTR
jgi:hypothetical protein